MGTVALEPARTVQGRAVPPHACMSAVPRLDPRIRAELLQQWFRDDIDAYLEGLILDDRSDRQGLPFEVIDEPLFLSDLRWAMRHDRPVVEAGHRNGDDYTLQTCEPVVSRSLAHPPVERC